MPFGRLCRKSSPLLPAGRCGLSHRTGNPTLARGFSLKHLAGSQCRSWHASCFGLGGRRRASGRPPNGSWITNNRRSPSRAHNRDEARKPTWGGRVAGSHRTSWTGSARRTGSTGSRSGCGTGTLRRDPGKVQREGSDGHDPCELLIEAASCGVVVSGARVELPSGSAEGNGRE